MSKGMCARMYMKTLFSFSSRATYISALGSLGKYHLPRAQLVEWEFFILKKECENLTKDEESPNPDTFQIRR